MSLQEALKRMRFELGMTQADMARRIHKAAISVNRRENGKGFPSRANAKDILALAKAENVSGDCLSYLNDMLMPDVKRPKSAAGYGFPDVDRDFIFQLADGSTTAIYVVEAETYNLLYANRKAEKLTAKFRADCKRDGGERRFFDQKDRSCFTTLRKKIRHAPFAR